MATGVLALQGCITPHISMLERIGEKVIRITSSDLLAHVDRLILPGGESTTMLTLMERYGLIEGLSDFGKTKPMWGICAGAILMAKEVHNPRQRSLQLMDILAERNHYGSQRESFKAKIEVDCIRQTIEGDFIRAPLLRPISKAVDVLATHGQDPVLLRQGRLLASSFHVELGADPRLHEYFLGIH